MNRIVCKLTPMLRMRGTLSLKVMDVPIYNGAFEVTPSTQEVILPTRDKKMLSDVKVKPIPVLEVPNEKGITLIVGG